jgi:putative ABC transport system permease protein
VLADLRYAIRSFLKTPALAATIVITLALGIGANTAIFSVIDAVLLRPAPWREIDRLAVVWETDRNTGTTREPASFPDYVDFKARSRTFDRMAAVMTGEVNLVPDSGDPVRLPMMQVTAETLPMLGIQPSLGRTFTADEDRPGGAAVVLISESLWERSFARHASAVGSTLRLDDRPYTIIGVLPDDTDFGVMQILSAAAYSRGFADRGMKTSVDLWAPLQADAQQLPRSTHPIFILGRLAHEATLAGAGSELAGISADLERAFPENEARGVHVEALSEVVFGPVRPALLVLLGAVVLVLLVACANVANLLLARASVRGQEAAVRAALGASTWRIARQVLAETLLLAFVASVTGVGLAYGGLRALVAIAPADVPRLSRASINLEVLLTTLAVATVAGLMFSVVPILQMRRSNLHASLASGFTRASASASRARLRSGLVVVELALSVMLVCGATLLARSFWLIQRVDPGFQAEGVLKAEYQLPPSRYPVDFRRWPDFTEQHAFNAALLQRAAALPGVSSVALAGNHPLDPGFTNSFTIVGREAESRAWPEISIRRVSPSYFRTVRLDLVKGRLFHGGDNTRAQPVAIINAEAERRFFAGREAVGAHIQFWGASRLIVGVVANERFHGLIDSAPIGVYTPLAQTPSAAGAGVLLVRAAGDPAALGSAAVSAIHDIDPGLAVFGVEPLNATVSRSVGQRRFTMLLLGLFAGTALLLAVVGIHGVLSYAVSQRRREFGIRMALGARAVDVVSGVVFEGLALWMVGLGVGLLGAFASTRLLANQLFGIAPTDPITFGGVAALLAVVALLSTAAPARRAAHVDPSVTLRAE